MAVPISDQSFWEFFKFTLSVVATLISILFTTVAWLIRLEVERAVKRLTKLEADATERQKFNDDFRDWVRTIFAIHGMLPRPTYPTGR